MQKAQPKVKLEPQVIPEKPLLVRIKPGSSSGKSGEGVDECLGLDVRALIDEERLKVEQESGFSEYERILQQLKQQMISKGISDEEASRLLK